MKLFIIAAAISLISLSSFANRVRGGDLPFPIGKIVDFPKDEGKGVWKDELKKKIFRLRPLKGVLDDGTILVQMLGLNKRSVIAKGFGQVGENQVLTARLTYVSNPEKYVDVKIVNLCTDATFDNAKDYSEMCENTEMWASIRLYDKRLRPSEQFMIKKETRRKSN